MQAFKNWWKNLLCSNNENFRIVAESAWRETLNEVLRQAENDLNICNNSCLVNWIKQELRDE